MTTKIEQKIGSLQHNLSLPDKFDMADLDTFKLYENPEIFLQHAGFKNYLEDFLLNPFRIVL